MAEINEVIERVMQGYKNGHEFARSDDFGYIVMATDALALIAELETVRAERDALRAALEEAYNYTFIGIDAQSIEDKNMTLLDVQRVTRVIETAQPAPQAWTPRKLIVTFDDNRYNYHVIQDATKHIDDFVGAGHTMVGNVGTWKMSQALAREAIASLMYAVREVDMYRFEPEWSDESDE